MRSFPDDRESLSDGTTAMVMGPEITRDGAWEEGMTGRGGGGGVEGGYVRETAPGTWDL